MANSSAKYNILASTCDLKSSDRTMPSALVKSSSGRAPVLGLIFAGVLNGNASAIACLLSWLESQSSGVAANQCKLSQATAHVSHGLSTFMIHHSCRGFARTVGCELRRSCKGVMPHLP